jgi:hypothetical protein
MMIYGMKNLLFVPDISGLIEELRFEHKHKEWWLFTDLFNTSLKAVLLFNRKKLSISVDHIIRTK